MAEWTKTTTLAWTDREGPGRPPAVGGRWLWLSTAATMGVVFSTMLFSDVVCPDHRVWVQMLASLALVGTVVSGVSLVQGMAMAPYVTVASALMGVAIGLIDAEHDPTRGGIIAAIFGLVTVLSLWMAFRQAPLRAWDRQLRAETAEGEAILLPADAAPLVERSEVDRPAEPAVD